MQKILLALLMALAKWLMTLGSVKRVLMVLGVIVAAAFFLVPLLVVLGLGATGVAIYLFVQDRKKAEQLKRAQEAEAARQD